MMKCSYSYPITHCLVLVSFLFSFLITGCGTTHESELLEIHDTITAAHVDTVRQYIKQTVYDTIHQHTERIVTVNERGDTVKEVNNNYYKERIIERDSSSYYRHMIDSLMKSLMQNHDKEAVTEKKPSFWERWKDGIIFLIFMGCFTVFFVWRAYRNC